LSTTFLEVILARTRFYKEEGKFLCWIFDSFSTLPEEQKFTDKDILYSNNCNALVANEETLGDSIKNGELTLECNYAEPKKPRCLKDPIHYKWHKKSIRFSELTFDDENHRLFYFDFEKRLEEVKQEMEEGLRTEAIKQKEFWEKAEARKLSIPMGEDKNLKRSKANVYHSNRQRLFDSYKCTKCGNETRDWASATPDKGICICRNCRPAK
jgi:competence CoiA-like predicted nuclease